MSNKVKLKVKPLDADGQAALLGRLKADPVMALREHAINGIEAIERETSSLKDSGISATDELLLPECYVEIRRDTIHPQKAVIVNAGGDYITTETAKNHLAALGQSGNHVSFFEGQRKDSNIGVGAKIATFALFPTIIYKSKKAGLIGGKKYTLTFKKSKLSLHEEDCSQEEFCMLQEKDSGTEIVLWGENKKQDTWDELNRVYISKRKKVIRAREGQTGNALRKWLSNRFANKFVDAWGRDIPIRVAEYEQGTYNLNGSPSIWYACEQVQNSNWGESADSSRIPWDGGEANLRVLVLPTDSSSKKQSNFRTTGGVTIFFKNEAYEQRLLSDHKASDALLTKCGLGMLPGDLKNKVWITVELEDTAPFQPTFDRTGLMDEKTGSPVDFEEEVAEKIAGSLNNLKKFSKWVKKNVEITDKSLEEQVMEEFQSHIDNMKSYHELFGGLRGRSVKGKGPGKGKGGGKAGSRGPLGNGGNLGMFNVEVVPNKDAELIELQIRNTDGKSTYCLTYNSLHKLHFGNYNIIKSMLQGDDDIDTGAFNSSKVRNWVDNALALKVFVSAFATILERKAFIKESNAELIKALTPQRLETGLTIETKKLIFKSLKKKITQWSNMKGLAA